MFCFSALFLVEAGNEKLWLWQGWWPDVGHEVTDTNMTTGSGIIRFHAERREAMRTIKEFQRSKFSKLTSQTRPPMELVWAGHEPLEFTNLFPSWTHHLDVKMKCKHDWTECLKTNVMYRLHLCLKI